MERPDTKPIAILIPVWNRQAKLERALRSLLPESALLKVVVIDDGSEPPVRLDAIPTLDVKLIRLPCNRGIATALNAGLRYVFEAGIPYVARLDSDDVALAGRFLKQLVFLERNPEIGICGGGYQECDTDGTVIGTVLPPREDRAIRRGMHLRTTLWHPTVMMRGAVARRVGFFDPARKCEDVDYFWRVLDVARAANLPEPLIRYEVGAADALTGTAPRRRALAREMLRLKLRRAELLEPLWWLGLLANACYFAGLSRRLNPVRNLVMRSLEGRAS